MTHKIAVDAYAAGCEWPVALSVPVDKAWKPGSDLLILSFEHNGMIHERERFAVVKRHPDATQASS